MPLIKGMCGGVSLSQSTRLEVIQYKQNSSMRNLILIFDRGSSSLIRLYIRFKKNLGHKSVSLG